MVGGKPGGLESVRRPGIAQGSHSGAQAIYHLYEPGALPANLHLDNFNKFLFPHRYASLSVFFDDDDGGCAAPPSSVAGSGSFEIDVTSELRTGRARATRGRIAKITPKMA